MNGIVFSIEEFSIYDGPGIRTTVFLKGCPLRCSWCHNPEGQSGKSEIVRSPNGCLHCGACEKYAAKKNGKTVYSEESIRHCPRKLLRISGESYSADTLIERIMQNEIILKDGGGITFSGGEPLSQHEFLSLCLRKLQNRLHTAIQTSGYCKPESFSEILDLADYFLFDLKLADPENHLRYTGVSNAWILENFHRLAVSKKPFTVRIPLIPGVTDTEENLSDIIQIMGREQVFYAELLPYNKLAGSKYPLCGRRYQPDFDPEQPPNPHSELFLQHGIKIKIL